MPDLAILMFFIYLLIFTKAAANSGIFGIKKSVKSWRDWFLTIYMCHAPFRISIKRKFCLLGLMEFSAVKTTGKAPSPRR